MSRKDYFKEEDKLKKISIIFSITLVLTIVVFMLIFNLYNKKLQENARQSLLELGNINTVVPNSVVSTDSEIVSSSEDKTINEINTKNNVVEKKKVVETKNEIKNEVEQSENVVTQNITNQNIVEENKNVKKELKFVAPLNGEIIKDFANETLLYSETLEEWTVHNGIDIKAPKTTVVVASESGRIESIKNDPRYGLTVIIAHDDNFKTVYSNLLTAEFVREGQEIEKGRTIGTVGETASFEAVEEPHLHFEMIKDDKYVNPTLYFK